MPASARCLAALLAALLILPPLPAGAAGRTNRQPADGAAASPLTRQQRVLQALNRLTFGPRPGDVAAVEAMGLDTWIDRQLHPQSIDDAAFEARLSAYPAMRLSLHDLIERFPSPAMIRQAEFGRRAIPSDPVERAIYMDQIAVYRQRQEQRARSQQRDEAAAPPPVAAGAMPLPSGMEPAPPPDMEPAPGDTPSLAAEENKLFADLGAISIVNLPPTQRLHRLLAMQPADFRRFLHRLSRADRVALFAGLTPQQRETVFALINPQLVVGGEVLVTRLLRDVESQRQLEAVMTDFWLNHFNVYLRKGPFAPWYLAQYQNKVILPHALGKFENLLVAVAQSPAMLSYLDQTESIGPHSLAAAMRAERMPGGRGPLGINENYARELMELHTLGVNGGYTQRDVIEVAKVFTGWGIERPGQGGGFAFNPRRHEPGPKVVLGRTIHAAGEREGLEVLHMLAMSPATAHHVCFQLAQRFVSDTPPAALVDAMAAAWMRSGGDIREVLRTMLHSPEFWSTKAYRSKVKTPEEYVLSAARAAGGDVAQPAALAEAMARLGMPLYGCQEPNGYPWTSQAWLNSGELLDRMNFSMALADNQAGSLMHWDALMNIQGKSGVSAESKEKLLENLLLNGVVSPQTREAALAELTKRMNTPVDEQSFPQQQQPAFLRPRGIGLLVQATPRLPRPRDQDAALMGGLLLGSPEFQRH